MVLVEVKKDSRSYFFYMPVGTPYRDAIDAAFLVADDIKELHDRALKQQEESQSDEESEESEEKESDE